jgi:hypothetical protein
VIDRRRLLDIVDQLRATVPAEVRGAQQVLERKEEVLANADEEAAIRLARADEEVERRVSESEITKSAEVRAEQIAAQTAGEIERLMDDTKRQVDAKVSEGEHLAREQMDEADRYALEMLHKLEEQLNAFVSSVRSGIDTLERQPANLTPSEQGELALKETG